jgi:hypothetical protein
VDYYVGYKIIESYVKKIRTNSWKDVFIKSPREIFEKVVFCKKANVYLTHKFSLKKLLFIFKNLLLKKAN